MPTSKCVISQTTLFDLFRREREREREESSEFQKKTALGSFDYWAKAVKERGRGRERERERVRFESSELNMITVSDVGHIESCSLSLSLSRLD